MIHLKQTCDTRRTRLDGTHPIVFRLTLKSKTRDIATGFACKKEQWNTQRNCLKAKSKQEELLVKRLKDQELLLLKGIRKYEEEFPNCVNVQYVKEYLQNNNKKIPSVLEFWEKEVLRLNQAKQFGNARNYQSALNGITLQVALNLPFERIDYKWLLELETKFREAGLKLNTISTYMRKLRSIYNKAINYGITDANSYPFRRYRIKSDCTNPRVASIEELQKFFAFSGNLDNQLYHNWNYGRLIFLLRGINFTDLALLTMDNIKHGRIIYKRSKTHKMYSVEILPLINDLINLYHDPKRTTLFPILTNQELVNNSARMQRIRQQRKTCNKWLRKIGQELRVKEDLSTYVFRYGYANACKSMGYSLDMIGEALGHSATNKVTSGYLDNYDLEVIDEMNRVVCNRVIGGD
ncbi:MAG: site-specific integrase [Vicingus serpentipes]|nr:site-specific integrase [Vicingus serpentipes]